MAATKLKVIVILGPTAAGKSALAVNLARHLGGEIISADSRQVYRGLDIGTGKITKRAMRGVRHHLLDVASPKRRFSVAQFVKLAERAIKGITRRGKIPIVIGGTGLYIDATLGRVSFPEIPPNQKLRRTLEMKSAAELYRMLRKLNPRRAKAIDRANPRRLIRAIEIAKAGATHAPKLHKPYRTLILGLARSKEELRRRIARAAAERVRRGLMRETKKLITAGFAQKRLAELGLDYRFAAEHLEKKISGQELLKKLEATSWQYAKRQMTWFRRHTDIQWIRAKAEAEALARDFLKR